MQLSPGSKYRQVTLYGSLEFQVNQGYPEGFWLHVDEFNLSGIKIGEGFSSIQALQEALEAGEAAKITN